MDSKELDARLKLIADTYADEISHFERVQSPLHPDRFLAGSLKLASMLREPSAFHLSMSLGIAVFLFDGMEFRDDITEGDVVEVLRCGFAYDHGFYYDPYENSQ